MAAARNHTPRYYTYNAHEVVLRLGYESCPPRPPQRYMRRSKHGQQASERASRRVDPRSPRDSPILPYNALKVEMMCAMRAKCMWMRAQWPQRFRRRSISALQTFLDVYASGWTGFCLRLWREVR